MTFCGAKNTSLLAPPTKVALGLTMLMATDQQRQHLANQLTKMVNELVVGRNSGGVVNATVGIEVPGKNFIFTAAAGEARPDTGERMTGQHRYHWASITKTLTATLILQLAEEGLFGAGGIDTHLAKLLLFAPEVMDRLHVMDGVSYGHKITLRHLLSHTSGIKDAIVDDGSYTQSALGTFAPNSFLGLLFDGTAPVLSPIVPWDPVRPNEPMAGMLNFYLNHHSIASTALFPPGKAFHYSDTGFVILALLIEHITGMSLHENLTKRIFSPLGMVDCYLAYRNDPVLGKNRQPESEIYAGNYAFLSSGLDLSFDWGGGGIVSSYCASNTFLKGLLTGKLFQHNKTLEGMCQWRLPKGLKPPRTGVGLGLFRTSYKGGELWGHSGAWGAKMACDPEAGIYLAGSVNQVYADANWHCPLIEAVKNAF